MPDAGIAVRRDGAVGVITFSRPEVLNAFDNALMAETGRALAGLAGDPAIRSIVVHGEGRAFSAGFDLKASAERRMADVADWKHQLEMQFDFIVQFWDCPKPTIAAVHGFCLAGAFELALACDITIAAEGTRFGEPEVRFGTGIVAMLLPWVTGPKQAKELLLTGNDRLDAAEALRIGIVNRVVPPERLMDEALATARTIATGAASAVQLTKRAINRTYEIMGLRQALLAALDTDVMLNAMGSPEKEEFARIRKQHGVKAAIAWRDARFGR